MGSRQEILIPPFLPRNRQREGSRRSLRNWKRPHFNILVRLAGKDRDSVESIRNITIGASNPSGSGTVQIPLAEVADVNLIAGPSFI